MDEATLQKLLRLTRQVFAGEVSRTQLATRPATEMAFVGTAIMLAARQGFVDDHNAVRGPYNDALERLLSLGIVNVFTPARVEGFRNGNYLVKAASSLGLYQSSRGRGGTRVVLTPPPGLLALVRELGCTPAVRIFLQDAEAGAIRFAGWRQEYNRGVEASARRSYAEQLADQMMRRYGREGLLALREAANRYLNG